MRLRDGFSGIVDTVKQIWQDVCDTVKDIFLRSPKKQRTEIVTVVANLRRAAAVVAPPPVRPAISGHASGGFPKSGQMFVAREDGIPEMVGKWGGRSRGQ